MTARNAQTARCRYCSRVYVIEPYHREQQLVGKWCSHGCRLGCQLALSSRERPYEPRYFEECPDNPVEVASDDRFRSALRHLVCVLRSIGPRRTTVLLERLGGATLQQIADQHHKTPQAVHQMLARLGKSHPFLQALIDGRPATVTGSDRLPKEAGMSGGVSAPHSCADDQADDGPQVDSIAADRAALPDQRCW